MPWTSNSGTSSHTFPHLKSLLAKASPGCSGETRPGLAATSLDERKAARQCLADVPLVQFLEDLLIPFEDDEISRLIIETRDEEAFAPLAQLSVGQFRDWLLEDTTDGAAIAATARGLTPEMVAATSKLMSNQDLVHVASKIRVITRFRNTQGLPGRMSVRLQPQFPTDDPHQVAASILEGLMHGCGDALIGVKPATPGGPSDEFLVHLLDQVISRYGIPTQSCVLTPAASLLAAIRHQAPVDLVFQIIAGSEEANRNHGINLSMLSEARQIAHATKRCPSGGQVMYFQACQNDPVALAANPDIDRLTLCTRALAVARANDPLLVTSVVGGSGKNEAIDGNVMVRAGLEDHFCGKLLGLPMGCDILCAVGPDLDDDMDTLVTMLGVAGCHSIMRIRPPGQSMVSLSHSGFHDSQYLRKVLGLRPAPEFEDWLLEMGIFDEVNRPAAPRKENAFFGSSWLQQLAAAHAV